MGVLYSIAKWSVNKLIKQGVDLTDIVQTDDHTKRIRNAANSLNQELISLQDQFALKRVEIIELQNQLIEVIEPTVMYLLSETDDNTVKTTMTKIWYDKMTLINKAVDEHELLIADFAKKHEQLQKLESKLY
jgi:hypothetical protein